MRKKKFTQYSLQGWVYHALYYFCSIHLIIQRGFFFVRNKSALIQMAVRNLKCVHFVFVDRHDYEMELT
jgi:hypothetical protein